MATKKSAKKPKSRARKPAKVSNLPLKTVSADEVRSVKGGRGASFSKIVIHY